MCKKCHVRLLFNTGVILQDLVSYISCQRHLSLWHFEMALGRWIVM